MDRGARNRRIRRCRSAAAPARTGTGSRCPSADDHHLARLDVADEVGADDVERAGLRGEDAGAVELAQHQRPDARADRARRSACCPTGRPANRRPRPGSARRSRRSTRCRWPEGAIRWMITSVSEVDWKIEPRRCSSGLQRQRVGEVAVVRDREAAEGELGEQRLDVALDRRAVGRIAHVADRRGRRQGSRSPRAW